MIIDCICGKKKFKLADGVMPQQGSKVRCGSCSEVWFYHPDQGNNPINQVDNVNEEQNSLIENENNIGENKEIDNLAATTQSEVQETENVNQASSLEDPEDLLSTPEDKLSEEEVGNENFDEIKKENPESISNFKIFTDEDQNDLPSKEEMDKNLDEYKVDRDKNLNFFQKLFKKDRIKEAKKSLEKEQQLQEQSEQQLNKGRRARLLTYLLLLLLIVFSVLIVPFRDQVGMAFPIMESYLEFLIPMYDYIKGPLGLS
ncbi:hypothetical protein [Candidatus Pelagibacter communis]|uniref:hypothetical protein n=1 Tax=Pelagibacter ubique TaxID=198252 RepID=UPI00094DA7E2|nr:hypothetical protein [Candidatus Pelagibacter ubique]